MIALMGKLSLGQKKFLAEFLGNFSLAWIVGAVVSPFFTGNLLVGGSWNNLFVGIINASWAFILALSLQKGVNS